MSGTRKFTSFIKSLSIPVSSKSSSASNSPRNSPSDGSPRLAGRNRSDSLTKPRNFFTPGLDMLPDERKKRAEAALPAFMKEIKNNSEENKDFLKKYYSDPLSAEDEAQLAGDFLDFAENKMEDLLSTMAALSKVDHPGAEELKAEETSSNSPRVPRSPQKDDEISNSPRVLRRYSIAPAHMPSIVMLFIDHVTHQLNQPQP